MPALGQQWNQRPAQLLEKREPKRQRLFKLSSALLLAAVACLLLARHRLVAHPSPACLIALLLPSGAQLTALTCAVAVISCSCRWGCPRWAPSGARYQVSRGRGRA